MKKILNRRSPPSGDFDIPVYMLVIWFLAPKTDHAH